MRFFCISFMLNIKRFFQSPHAVCACVLAPLLAYGAAVYVKSPENAAVVRVGVFSGQERLAAYAADFVNKYSNAGIEAALCYNEDDLINGVAKGQIAAGYVIGAEARNFAREAITVYVAENAAAYKLSNELITAALLYDAAPSLTASELSKIFNIESAEALAYAEEAVGAYMNGQDIFVKGIFKYADPGAPIEGEGGNESPIAERLTSGACSLLLLLAALMFSPLAALRGLARSSSAAVAASGFAARLLAVSVSGAAALLLTSFSLNKLAAVFAYSFAVCAFASLFKREKSGAAYVAAAAAVILSLLIGGTVMDVNEFFPQIGVYAQYLPTALFHDGRIAPLFLEGIACLAAAVCIKRITS